MMPNDSPDRLRFLLAAPRHALPLGAAVIALSLLFVAAPPARTRWIVLFLLAGIAMSIQLGGIVTGWLSVPSSALIFHYSCTTVRCASVARVNEWPQLILLISFGLLRDRKSVV